MKSLPGILETPRLRLIPLPHAQLIRYSRLPASLAIELDLKPVRRVVPESLKEGLDRIISDVKNNPDNYLFYTIWTIISIELNIMVGDIFFKGKPDENGNVEIGYGTYDDFAGKGYMTQTVGAITEWAYTQKGVSAVIAETLKENMASQKVLQKNGYVQFKETHEMILWKHFKNETHE
ncbi:MAG: N-acetyltransferase [Flavobacterium sp.]|nr:MAG: N-acetyltransferase [Flavobacterium sp.]